jgi:hypothetical protein
MSRLSIDVLKEVVEAKARKLGASWGCFEGPARRETTLWSCDDLMLVEERVDGIPKPNYWLKQGQGLMCVKMTLEDLKRLATFLPVLTG